MSSWECYLIGSIAITADFDSSIGSQEFISDLELRVSDRGAVIYGADIALMERVEVYSVSGRLISKDVNAKLPLLLGNSNLASGIKIIVCTSGEITR